jgi:tetratricopeptide (TPR) repeat protein
MKSLPHLSLVIAGLCMLGCETTRVATPRIQPSGDPIADGKVAMAHSLPQDRLLWEYRLSAAAMRRAQFTDAKQLLDDAILTLDGIYGKDANAKKSRGMFHEESKKTFIGEPYERVMAYFYRGIIYWMDGEPDNARACFRSAQIADSDTQNKTYAGDYALLDYLDGLVSAKLAGDGSDALKRAQAEARLEKPPAYDSRANVLFFVEYGNGPVKYATGQYREQLRLRPGPPGVTSATVTVDGQILQARPYDDLYFQATTRGGRVMDYVLANKAVFKRTTDAVGDASIISGAILAGGDNGRTADEVGAGLMAFGVLSKVVSSATTPEADTRMWNNLPQYLSFATAKLPVGQHSASIQFHTRDGATVAAFSRNATINVTDPAKDIVVFFSDKTY